MLQFDEIRKMTKGQKFYSYGSQKKESNGYILKDVPLFETVDVKSTPTSAVEKHDRVTLTGIDEYGAESKFMITRGLEHYGPSIYLYEAYTIINPIKDFIV